MRSEMRMRHYCGYCKKSGGQKRAMLSHEQACTANPKRVCKLCALMDDGEVKAELGELMALLPDPSKYVTKNEWGKDLDYTTFSPLLDAAIPKLRELAQGCPACMMAALRQKGIAFNSETFDFKKEMDVAFKAAIDNPRYD